MSKNLCHGVFRSPPPLEGRGKGRVGCDDSARDSTLPCPLPSKGGGPKARPGVALIEMLIAIVLLLAFSLVSAKLFHAVTNISADAKPRPLPDRGVMQALDALRADVWNAMELKLENEKELLVTQAGETQVVWTIGAEGMTRRATVKKKERPAAEFKVAHVPTGFEPIPGGVRVTMPDKHLRGTETMLSQLQLLKGGGR